MFYRNKERRHNAHIHTDLVFGADQVVEKLHEVLVSLLGELDDRLLGLLR